MDQTDATLHSDLSGKAPSLGEAAKPGAPNLLAPEAPAFAQNLVADLKQKDLSADPAFHDAAALEAARKVREDLLAVWQPIADLDQGQQNAETIELAPEQQFVATLQQEKQSDWQELPGSKDAQDAGEWQQAPTRARDSFPPPAAFVNLPGSESEPAQEEYVRSFDKGDMAAMEEPASFGLKKDERSASRPISQGLSEGFGQQAERQKQQGSLGADIMKADSQTHDFAHPLHSDREPLPPARDDSLYEKAGEKFAEEKFAGQKSLSGDTQAFVSEKATAAKESLQHGAQVAADTTRAAALQVKEKASDAAQFTGEKFAQAKEYAADAAQVAGQKMVQAKDAVASAAGVVKEKVQDAALYAKEKLADTFQPAETKDEGFRSRGLGPSEQQDIMKADSQTHEFAHPLHNDQERLPKPLDSSIYDKAGSAEDTKFEGKRFETSAYPAREKAIAGEGYMAEKATAAKESLQHGAQVVADTTRAAALQVKEKASDAAQYMGEKFAQAKEYAADAAQVAGQKMVQAKDAMASAAGITKGKIQKAAWVAKEKWVDTFQSEDAQAEADFDWKSLGERDSADVMKADARTHKFTHPLHSDNERLPAPLDASIYQKAAIDADDHYERRTKIITKKFEKKEFAKDIPADAAAGPGFIERAKDATWSAAHAAGETMHHARDIVASAATAAKERIADVAHSARLKMTGEAPKGFSAQSRSLDTNEFAEKDASFGEKGSLAQAKDAMGARWTQATEAAGEKMQQAKSAVMSAATAAKGKVQDLAEATKEKLSLGTKDAALSGVQAEPGFVVEAWPPQETVGAVGENVIARDVKVGEIDVVEEVDLPAYTSPDWDTARQQGPGWQKKDIMKADSQTHEFAHPLHNDQERLPKPLDSSIYDTAGSAEDTKFEGKSFEAGSETQQTGGVSGIMAKAKALAGAAAHKVSHAVEQVAGSLGVDAKADQPHGLAGSAISKVTGALDSVAESFGYQDTDAKVASAGAVLPQQQSLAGTAFNKQPTGLKGGGLSMQEAPAPHLEAKSPVVGKPGLVQATDAPALTLDIHAGLKEDDFFHSQKQQQQLASINSDLEAGDLKENEKKPQLGA